MSTQVKQAALNIQTHQATTVQPTRFTPRTPRLAASLASLLVSATLVGSVIQGFIAHGEASGPYAQHSQPAELARHA